MEEKWWEKYVGKPWVENQYDCGALVVEVENNEFGRPIYLPYERLEYTLEEQQAIIGDLFPEQLDEVDTPQTGDIVLMKWNGRDTHVGIYVVQKNVPYVLHCVEKTGVCFTRVRTLPKLHCSISTIYRPKVAAKSPLMTAGINTASSDEGLAIGAAHSLPAPAITEP